MSELPTGWVEATLQDLCEFNPKHDPETDRATTVSFIPMPAVDDETGAIVDRSAIRPLSEVWKGYTHFADADVIFAKITPCMENGKIAVARDLENGMACGSTEFHVLRSKGAVEPDFVWRFLRQRSYRQVAERSMTGAVGQRRVPKPFLEGTVLPLPPLAEQKRIVAKLASLNAKSARARTELARIETLVSRYKQAVLSKAFSGELTRDWRASHLSELPGPNKQSSLLLDDSERGVWDFNSLPEQWEWRHFDAVFTDLTDGKRKLPQKEYLSEGPYPVVDQGITKVGGYTDRTELLHPAEAPFVVFGDHTRCVKYIEERFVQGADGVKVFHSAADVSLSFAFLALSAVGLPNKGYSRHMKFVRSTIFPVAPLEEQYEIVRRIEAAFAKIDRLAKEANRALELVGKLDEAILAKAFRGELVRQDEGYEPAEHLLARIRAEREAAPKVKKRVMKRTSAMLTARDFLNAKLPNWPHDGISFQDLRSEFSGSYDDLKDAVFTLLSDENALLRQVFDEKRSVMTLKRREQ